MAAIWHQDLAKPVSMTARIKQRTVSIPKNGEAFFPNGKVDLRPEDHNVRDNYGLTSAIDCLIEHL